MRRSPKSTPKKASRHRPIPKLSKGEHKKLRGMPRSTAALHEESLKRHLRRWAKRLILVVDGEVRHLTADEIEMALRDSAPKSRSRSTGRRS
jgi:hypothetical protein